MFRLGVWGLGSTCEVRVPARKTFLPRLLTAPPDRGGRVESEGEGEEERQRERDREGEKRERQGASEREECTPCVFL